MNRRIPSPWAAVTPQIKTSYGHFTSDRYELPNFMAVSSLSCVGEGEKSHFQSVKSILFSRSLSVQTHERFYGWCRFASNTVCQPSDTQPSPSPLLLTPSQSSLQGVGGVVFLFVARWRGGVHVLPPTHPAQTVLKDGERGGRRRRKSERERRDWRVKKKKRGGGNRGHDQYIFQSATWSRHAPLNTRRFCLTDAAFKFREKNKTTTPTS